MTNAKRSPAPLVEVPADEALKVEAEEVELFEFEFEGNKYSYDQELIVKDSDIMEAFEEGKVIVPLKVILGEEQYALFKSRGKNGKRSMYEINALADAMFAGKGVSLGE